MSFYGRPQDKLNNIALGFAVGVIGGACYTTYKAATQPRDFYRGAQLWEDEERERELRFAQGALPALKTGVGLSLLKKTAMMPGMQAAASDRFIAAILTPSFHF